MEDTSDVTRYRGADDRSMRDIYNEHSPTGKAREQELSKPSSAKMFSPHHPPPPPQLSAHLPRSSPFPFTVPSRPHPTSTHTGAVAVAVWWLGGVVVVVAVVVGGVVMGGGVVEAGGGGRGVGVGKWWAEGGGEGVLGERGAGR